MTPLDKLIQDRIERIVDCLDDCPQGIGVSALMYVTVKACFCGPKISKDEFLKLALSIWAQIEKKESEQCEKET